MINLFNYLLISGVFTSGFVLFRTPFEFYISYIFMILFVAIYFFHYHKIQVNKVFLLILMSVSILSLLNIFWGNNSAFSLLKQFGGFILNGVVYYLLIRINKSNINKLFRIYLKLAIIVAVIGIIQEVSFLIGFTYGYDYSYFIPKFNGGGTALGMLRVTSILPEPSHFGGAMAPAMFVSVLNIIRGENSFIGRNASVLIITSILLSFSLTAYVGIVMALILIMLNYKRVGLIAVVATILIAFAVSSYRYIPEIRIRVDDTYAVVAGRAALGEGNLSTFAFISNASVAYKSFMNNPLFGAGMGSHPISYNKYIEQLVGPDAPAASTSPLCVDDAGSLFFRLMSETGLFGMFLFFYFIIKFYVSRKRDAHFWIISNSIICLFGMNLIRLGNFFYCGFIFFVWAYYFASKCADGNRSVCESGKIY